MDDMSGMSGMSGMTVGDSDSTGMMMMSMTFYTSTTTPLYSTKWAPSSVGQYAGTCIFLIALAIAFRGLLAAKFLIEAYWLDKERDRRYVTVVGKQPVTEKINTSPKASTGKLISEQGVEESVRIVSRHARSITPFRLSIDIPRAILATTIAGVGYLLMLAVMTFNVGYFLSVLAGIFVGELVVGRYAMTDEH